MDSRIKFPRHAVSKSSKRRTMRRMRRARGRLMARFGPYRQDVSARRPNLLQAYFTGKKNQ